ncbi:MAG: diacylglycerol kinase family protein [Acetivibrio sp.]
MYYFIINPASKSGLGKKIWSELESILIKKQIVYKFYYTKGPFHAAALVREILQFSGEKHIVVVGGDGTLNEAANGFSSYEGVTLTYIPSGSGNDFARGIGISGSASSLLTHLLESPVTKYYDQGICRIPKSQTNRKFTISCGIGFDAVICWEALHSPLKKVLNKMHLGKLTYLGIALKQLFLYKEEDVTLLIDENIRRKFTKVLFIAAMNQPYEGGGFKMVKETNSQDGLLSIAVFHNMSKAKALFMLLFIVLGLQNHVKGFETFSCRSLEVHTKTPQIVHTDGEYAGTTRCLHIEMDALKIKYLE